MCIKFLTIFFMLVTTGFASNNINNDLEHAMKTYHIPVVGYAIIKDYKILLADTLSIDPNLVVSNNSLFQAASISKSISAYGVLILVSKGKLKLDESVNNQLSTWKIPINKYSPVTLRHLLDMTSGLSISGFPGYHQSTELPTLKQVLDGKPPANTGPVRVFYEPGSQYFYSGGAYQVLEQLIEDSTKKSYQSWMNEHVLKPLNMQYSTFQTPLNGKLKKIAIPGFLANGAMIKGGWNNYPVASAGGLWTTPTDLAKFAIIISSSYAGLQKGLISKSNLIEMLKRQKNTDYGLGVVINGKGRTLNFRKAGHNLGYHNELLMFPNTGDGIVIMTNSENGGNIIDYIIPIIAQKYQWLCYFPFFDELISIPEQAC
jgi:CubicO group peptidase (beta-lactamase class C family)